MGAVTLKFTGGPKMARLLNQMAKGFPDQVLQGLRLEAEFIMTESKKIVPVDKSPLKTSGHVQDAVRKGKDLSILLAYGGPSAPYALIQHERLDYSHTEGQQAKYLEQPFNSAVPGMANRIARGIKL